MQVDRVFQREFKSRAWPFAAGPSDENKGINVTGNLMILVKESSCFDCRISGERGRERKRHKEQPRKEKKAPKGGLANTNAAYIASMDVPLVAE